MYRKYKGNFETNKVVQILNDNTVCNLPLIKAGANVSKVNNLKDISCISMSKFNNYFINCCDNMLYIYNLNLKLIDKIMLDNDVKDAYNNYIQFIDLEDKCLIVYGKGVAANGSVNCKLLQNDNGKFKLSESTLISGSYASNFLTACKLTNNKVVVGYYKASAFLVNHPPFLSIVKIEDDKINVSESLELNGVAKESFTQNLYLTKINDMTFLYMYCIKDSSYDGRVVATVLEVNAQNDIIQSKKTFNLYNKFDTQSKIPTTAPPIFIKNNLIMTFDYDSENNKALVVLKEIIKKDAEFIVTDIANIDINSNAKVMTYFLKMNEENNVFDFVIASKLNRYLYAIRLDFNKNEFEYVNKYDVENTDIDCMASLEKKQIVAIDRSNNLYLIKISDVGGNIIGIAKENDIVCVNGLCELKNVNLKTGKKYYFDSDGTLTADEENNTFLGYSIDTNKLIVFPDYYKQNTITKSYKGNAIENKVVQILADNTIKDLPVISGIILGLHIENGKVIIQGFAKIGLELVSGQKYYFDTNGSLTLDSKNTFLGYAVSSNMLYIPKFLG